MLSSGFSESVSNKHVHTINLEDMDFGCVRSVNSTHAE